MKHLLLFVVLCLSSTVFAQRGGGPQKHPYYGSEFYQKVGFGESNVDLRMTLREILQWDHERVPNDFDRISEHCQGRSCYRHTAIGYSAARTFLLGFFYLVQNNGQFGVRDVYCEKVYGPNEFRGDRPGPNRVPDHRVVNVEHTWPQSRFSRRYDVETQKSDLHHLFPTDTELNSIRSSFPFGDVQRDARGELKCGGSSRFGTTERGQTVFEVPDHHKGNVARAIFYFAVRYDMQIDPAQEQTLRMWNREDAVDQEEAARNEEIYKAQGNRNPFVDYPMLVERITDY